jgi:hypothetical protein
MKVPWGTQIWHFCNPNKSNSEGVVNEYYLHSQYCAFHHVFLLNCNFSYFITVISVCFTQCQTSPHFATAHETSAHASDSVILVLTMFWHHETRSMCSVYYRLGSVKGKVLLFWSISQLQNIGHTVVQKTMLSGSRQHGMACAQVADGGDGLQIWRVVAHILNKQFQPANRGWSSSLGVGVGDKQPPTIKPLICYISWLRG